MLWNVHRSERLLELAPNPLVRTDPAGAPAVTTDEALRVLALATFATECGATIRPNPYRGCEVRGDSAGSLRTRDMRRTD